MPLKLPPIIYFTGLDGSGKTTFVNMLAQEARRQGLPVKVAWLRMSHYLSKPLLLFCRTVGLTEYEEIDGVRVGYHHFYRSKAVSWLYIFLRGIDTWFDALFRVYLPAKLFGKTVICDRYVYDTIIDLMIDTHRSGLWYGVLAKLLRLLLPQESITFLISREDEEIRACRPELRSSKIFTMRKNLYAEIGKYISCTNIQNNVSPDAAFEQIRKALKVT